MRRAYSNIDYEKNYEVDEVAQWHYANIVSYAIKLAERDETQRALKIARLLTTNDDSYEDDTYFNTIASIAKRLAKRGQLKDAEELVSISQMPKIDDDSLEDAIRSLLVISNEYAKQNNIHEVERLLLIAEDLLNKRSNFDETQANLALSLAFYRAKFEQLDKALDWWTIAIRIADDRLIEAKEVENFGFEEREIIAAAIQGIAKSISLKEAEVAFQIISDDKAKKKAKQVLQQIKGSLKL